MPERRERALPLLQTKLQIPLLREDLIERPDLLQALSPAPGLKLTLVSAPAGFGKTTLLAQWARTSGEQVAWLSLDEGDNAFTRFLAYLLAALRRPAPDVGEAALALLGSARSLPPEQLLISLLNDIAALPPELPLVLILDDYHLITNPVIHEQLSFLLEHLPRQLRLLLATRADPPLRLSRLRGRRELKEIRQADLQLSLAQAAAFLNDLAGLALTPAEISTLYERSEGWVTGLQMAALALADLPGRDNSDRQARVAAFAGSQRYILDYLLEEVLHRQPPALRSFLLQTSLLPRLSASLCTAILEEDAEAITLPDGRRLAHPQAVLEYLEAANLFVVPLDGARHWYRYHHLFADLLTRRLQQERPEHVSLIRQRASQWFEQEGLLEMAITQALAAGAYDRAARLLEEAAAGLLMRSEIGTLLRLLAALPEEIVHERPLLRTYAGGARLLMGEPLERVIPLLGGANGDTIPELAAFRALLAMLQGDIAASEAYSHQALALLPAGRTFLRGLVAENLGFVAVLRGDLEKARAAFVDAIHLAQASDNLLVAVGTLCNLAGLHVTAGALRQAESAYQEALALARDDRGRLLPIAGKALFGLGDLYREWDRLQEAATYLSQARDLFAQYGEIGLIFANTSLARVHQAQGDSAAAEARLLEAERQAAQMDSTQMDDLLVHIYRVHLSLLQGRVEQAARRAPDLLRQMPAGAPQFQEAVQGTLARLHLAQGEPAEALALLQPLQATATQKGQKGSQIKLSVPLALALEALGRRDEALALLKTTLELARPQGYTRTFLDESAMPYGREALPRLLYIAVEQGIEPAYAGRLLAALAEQQPLPAGPPPLPDSASADLIEPLSERELEVLALIAAGLSNRQIAGRLVIALSTVKGHSSNIYGKLGVSKRTEAVARARALGIIK